jgi:ABC-type glycerol-3-phosphate transport system permease component
MSALKWLGVLAVLFGLGFPLYCMLVASIVPEAHLFERLALLPTAPTLEHYRALISSRRFWVPVQSSLIVAGSTSLLSIVIGSACAYALARLRFRGKALIIAGTLAISMFPQISIVSPLYLLLRSLGLIDTYPGLVLPYLTFALPLSVWLLYAYFRQLPRELEEAALIDGASRLRALWEVVVPLALPGVVTTAILTFVYCWNEFLFALSFTIGPEHQTVPVAIALLRGRYQVPWGEVMAAATVATLPVALIVIVFQRRIVRTFGARVG